MHNNQDKLTLNMEDLSLINSWNILDMIVDDELWNE